MGFHSQISSIVAPARLHAASYGDQLAQYSQAFFSGEDMAASTLGGDVSPELALTLSYVYCAVDTISADFGTSTCQMFENLGDDGRARVKFNAPSIGTLARKLRWQPNAWQTAKAFWSTLAWQYCLRPAAYAEIVYRDGIDGFVDQLVPRHPDRVREQRLPSGRILFTLIGEPGGDRRLTQDEMFVVRNTSTDGLNALSRVQYGSRALTSALALQNFTTSYFKKGTPALLATYKGEKDEPDEDALHKSITRFTTAENAGGIMLVPEDIAITSLGVDPEKAELLGLKNISGRDVARLFKMPPSWLGIEGAASYNSQIQDATNYKNRCQLPMAVEFEQAIQRDLILATDRFFVKFNMDYLTRGNLLERMQAYEIGIRSRILRPSEARVKEDMSPDAALDKLSEGDFRPGSAGQRATDHPQKDQEKPADSAPSSRAQVKGLLAMHDNARRCVSRERQAVSKLAQKHANNADGWQAGLKAFYEEHAGFVAQTMRMPIGNARAYSAQHGSQFEATGVGLIDEHGHWERAEAEDLLALALSEETVAA